MREMGWTQVGQGLSSFLSNFYHFWWIFKIPVPSACFNWKNHQKRQQKFGKKCRKAMSNLLETHFSMALQKPKFRVVLVSDPSLRLNMKYLPVWKSGGGDNGGTDEIIKGSTTSNTEFGLGARPFRIDGLLDGGWCISDIGDINSEIGLWLPPERWKKV